MTVKLERTARVTTITINRPEVRNAVDGETASALAKAFVDFENDTDAHVAVLCGADGTFCAGADLKAISATDESGQLPFQLRPVGNGPLGPTRQLLQKPVIAAISGHAVAGGLEVALGCDLRVVENDATLGVFCRRWGVPLMDGGTIRLPRLIGLSRALDLILTGRPVDAEEALQVGLVNRVVGPGRARETALELAEQIARFPQQCLRNDRLSAYEQFSKNLPDALLNEFNRGMATLQSGETVKGAQRFASGKGRHGDFKNI